LPYQLKWEEPVFLKNNFRNFGLRPFVARLVRKLELELLKLHTIKVGEQVSKYLKTELNLLLANRDFNELFRAMFLIV